MDIDVLADPQTVAMAAADSAIQTLSTAINNNGSAVWVLAGGSTPNLAYDFIASARLDGVAWSAVTILLGDERIGPLDGPDNNWHVIENLLLQYIPEATLLRPRADLDTEAAAIDYEKQLAALPKTSNGHPRFDLLWLGMGEDGHTLSLFPGDENNNDTQSLVVAIHNSPKPPADRVSLSLTGLSGTQECVILACGEAKRDALTKATTGQQLPIAMAASRVELSGGTVTWLVDVAAAPTL